MLIDSASILNRITPPDHYIKERLIEPLEVIESWELNYHLGNVLKYISRAGRKLCEKTDLEKALCYIDRFLRNCTSARAEGYIKKEQQFSVENIAHDWNLNEFLKEAITHLHAATYHKPTANVESAQKYINLRLNQLQKKKKEGLNVV